MKTNLLFTIALCLVFSVVTGSLSAQTDPGTDNLTHLWTFNDGTTTDEVGGANGVLVGGADVFDGDLVTSDTGQWMEMSGIVISMNAYTEVTVAVWFTSKPLGNPAWSMLWYFGGSEPATGGDVALGSNGVFFQPARNDDKTRTAISCGDIETPWSTETGVDYLPELDSGNLNHAVTYVNATEIGLYINGEFIGSAALEGDNSLVNVKTDFAWLGRGGYAGDDNWQGNVHEFSIYDKALSADEVTFLYQRGAITGIDEIKSSFNPRIYSANGLVYIENLGSHNLNSVEIYDMVGKLVYKTNVFSEIINPNLPENLYIVRIQSDNDTYQTKISIR
ncbi:MAG: T9SS type A sorting domain-containing protein [Bacteroidales bacterium]|nr:MAG: T9SS type A sorting domain-containing protein [Bacteroidales bacterium]